MEWNAKGNIKTSPSLLLWANRGKSLYNVVRVSVCYTLVFWAAHKVVVGEEPYASSQFNGMRDAWLESFIRILFHLSHNNFPLSQVFTFYLDKLGLRDLIIIILMIVMVCVCNVSKAQSEMEVYELTIVCRWLLSSKYLWKEKDVGFRRG